MVWYCTLCNTQLHNGNTAVQAHILNNPGCRNAVFSQRLASSTVSTISGSERSYSNISLTPAVGDPQSAESLTPVVGDQQAIDCYFLLNQIGVSVCDFGVPLSRNILSVGIPTAIREAMRRGPLAMLSTACPYASYGLGIGSCALPIINQIIGLARDQKNGNQTTISLLSRVLLIMAVGSTCVTAMAMGTLASAAPALVAANVFYTPLRDVAQYFIKVGGGFENGISQGATALSAATYFINQLAVNFGMDAVVSALQPALSTIVSNIVGRSIVNVLGETADDIILGYFNSIATSRTTPKFSIGLRSIQDINRRTAFDQIFNVNASRSSLFSTLFNVAYYVKSDAWSNFGAAGAVALAYMPFINVASQSTSASVDVNALESGQSGLNITSAQLPPSVTVVNERLHNNNFRSSLSQRSLSRSSRDSQQNVNSLPSNTGISHSSPKGGPGPLEIITRY